MFSRKESSNSDGEIFNTDRAISPRTSQSSFKEAQRKKSGNTPGTLLPFGAHENFEAALDSTHRCRLLNALRADGVRRKFVHVINDSNRRTTTAMQTPARCVPAFEVETRDKTLSSSRLAERSNYTATCNSPKMVLSIILPILALLSVLIATVVLILTLIHQILKHQDTQKYDTQPRLYQVLRMASGDEIQNSSLVKLSYPNCGKDLYIGCWRRVESLSVISDDKNSVQDFYVRNVFAYTLPDPDVFCPPSIFVGKNSPMENCTSPYD
ncbi:hypothetical protein RB195_013756 [Necator americanus]|uniref:Uncharacterized protein n=1 Tax=Necator americanus TaxID=51031 RepID=A0ABR1DX90_NECAM